MGFKAFWPEKRNIELDFHSRAIGGLLLTGLVLDLVLVYLPRRTRDAEACGAPGSGAPKALELLAGGAGGLAGSSCVYQSDEQNNGR